MAIVESGTLGRLPSVSECLAHPAMCEQWGIESTSIMVVGGEKVESTCVKPVNIGGVLFEIYRHPDLLIPNTIKLWREEYEVKNNYGTRLEYDEFHPCYIEAGKIFSNFKGGISNG